MQIQSIRRLTADLNHNAFTGATFFKGDLYVAFRQGDAHACTQGKLIVLRSRNEGKSFDIVATIRGEHDTRDAHLYVAGDRMHVVGFEAAADKSLFISGTASTGNGLNWSAWTRYQGPKVPGLIFWRPRWFGGRHYCAAYDFDSKPDFSRVIWFDSPDGIHWEPRGQICAGEDQPNESFLQFKPDGTAVLLVRREFAKRSPLLVTAKPPYTDWQKTELDIALAGPALWLTDTETYISGRWFPHPRAAHVAVFHLEGNKPVLDVVLPSGPGFDCSYMGVAQHPLNKRRFFLSYYSNHEAPLDPMISQWDHPDIYLADVTVDGSFIEDWKVSRLLTDRTLASAPPPNPADAALAWQNIRAADRKAADSGFVDVHKAVIQGRAGIVYLVTDLEVGPVERGAIHLGYDGPVKVWLNDEKIFEGPGNNPAIPDSSSVGVRFRHGRNRLAIALDTNGGKAWGIFARYDAEG